jgi:hypothetical protein
VRSLFWVFVCVFVVVSAFCFWMTRWWTLETTAAPFSPSLHLEMMCMRLFHHGKWRSCFETKRKHPFGDFWHLNDDFAIKNATNIISKAEKAPSYSSLHALSNDAKRSACLHGNRKENGTAMALSIVIICTVIHRKAKSFWRAPTKI